jgi:Stress responsive A/B Barrel Domain
MIRHCVFVTLAPGTSEAATTAIVEALRGLPEKIPEIRSYEVGTDLGWREGNPDIGIVATFDDEDGWRTYQSHPAHVAAIDEHIAPHATGRSSVQFEV